jgi:hypothetical protein
MKNGWMAWTGEIQLCIFNISMVKMLIIIKMMMMMMMMMMMI